VETARTWAADDQPLRSVSTRLLTHARPEAACRRSLLRSTDEPVWRLSSPWRIDGVTYVSSRRRRHREGLRAARFLMVVGSFAPLFVLWAIRGTRLISDAWLVAFCVVIVVVPNGVLLARIATAKKHRDTRELVVGVAEDHRDHLLVYLFAMLLPFYTVDLGSWQAVFAVLAAFLFIAFLFWHLNLHYMNLLLAIRGYRIFTVYPPADGNPLTSRTTLVLITQRVALNSNERIVAYRLSDSVYLEVDA
jgi:hypothetical protein